MQDVLCKLEGDVAALQQAVGSAEAETGRWQQQAVENAAEAEAARLEMTGLKSAVRHAAPPAHHPA
jgi:hypothetical protein